jgi:RND family efflux transporter MFP subunit
VEITADHDNKKATIIVYRLITALLMLSLICLAIFFGYERIKERMIPPKIELRPSLPVCTIKAEGGFFEVTHSYTGTIISAQRATIAAQVNSLIRSIHFREGQSVEKGAILINLDDREFKAELGRLEATSAQIQADLDFWKLKSTRDSKLLQGKAISPQEREESKRMVTSLKASLNANQFAISVAKIKLSHTLIHAPFSGSIQQMYVEVGELAVFGRSLLDLVGTRHLKAKFSVPQTDVRGIGLPERAISDSSQLASSSKGLLDNPGKEHSMTKNIKVTLVLPFSKEKIPTGVTCIYPALEPVTRNATFETEITGQLDGVFPGMTVEAVVTIAQFENTIVVPRAAIRTLRKKTGVYIVEDNAARWRPVLTGEYQGQVIRIKSGLAAGDSIIITPDPRIKDGDKIQQQNNEGCL